MRKLLFFQAAYYIVTGAWPLVHMDGFLEVTGSKTDLWLVRMVASLTLAVALELLLLRRRVRQFPLGSGLGPAVAIAFLLVDIVHVIPGVIAPVYLVDALVEAIFVGCWWWLRVPEPPWPITRTR
ncbi:MAG: hypothetical protein ACO1NQ_02390 [Flavobacteriales bacterium]